MGFLISFADRASGIASPSASAVKVDFKRIIIFYGILFIAECVRLCALFNSPVWPLVKATFFITVIRLAATFVFLL